MISAKKAKLQLTRKRLKTIGSAAKQVKLGLNGRSVSATIGKRSVTRQHKSPKSVVVVHQSSVSTAEQRAYEKAVQFLQQQTDYERMRIVRYNTTTFNLDRMRRLLKLLGNPHMDFKCTHVAGTKGKGSTCHMLAAMLQSAGFKVGLYTSPHLIDMRERIRINDEMISRGEMVRLVRRVELVLRKMAADPPTFFEILTAMSFRYFSDKKVDIAVIETGLGGRLDSTNVINPEVTGITSISYDHTAVLGNTLAKITEEKAGIFKKGVPAVSVIQAPEASAVLERVARNVHAPLEFVGTDIEFSHRFEVTRPRGPHVRVCLTTERSRFEHLTVPLIGEHQAVNCGLALAMLDKLKVRGFEFDDARAIEGLQKLKLPGRIEIVWHSPKVIVDGAHNAASVQALFRGISQYIPYDSMVVIFGCNVDKDIDGMLEQVSLGADKVIFTKVDENPKSASPEELSGRYVERFGKMAQVAANFQEAMDIATRAITREDLVTVTGSFYLVGQAKQFFIDRAVQN
jgi:dihydrofolate synthase / folylpolyglutamate synthase